MKTLFLFLTMPFALIAKGLALLAIKAGVMFGAVGPNTEIGLYQRIANLESTIYGGPNPLGTAVPLFQQPPPTVYAGSTDALVYPAFAVINSTGVDATTLATPVVGLDDGKILSIVSNTAHAHTITTAASTIVDGASAAGDTLTFAAHVGASVTLQAYGGLWFVKELSNVTLSEV